MTLALAFWILMFLWLVFSAGLHWGYVPAPATVWGNSLLLFLLFLILGWHSFGAPLRGG